MKMKALVYEGPKQMNMRSVAVPEPEPDEVLIRVERVGICGSELSGYLGHNSLRKPPLVMGHEFAGTVAKAGELACGFVAGERVTANPLVTCGDCRHCRSGESQLCGARQLMGAHRPGAFAEYIAVPSRKVYRLPDNVTMEEGALTEPVACAVHACRLLRLTPTDRVLIYGAGPIGLLALQAAQAYGVSRPVILDLNEERLEIASELGGLAATRLQDIGEASGFDAVIDAVGAGFTRRQSVAAARPGGRVLFTGLHEADSALPVNDMIRGEIETKGAFAYSREDFETALQWIAEGRISLTAWTETAPLEEGGACFEKLIAGPGNTAKILLKM